MATKEKTAAAAAEKKPAKKAAPKKAASAAEAKAPAAKAAKKVPSGKTVTITQVHSAAGRYANQRGTLIGLGLNKIGRVRELPDTPQTQGMIAKVRHLVRVVEGKK